MKKAILITGHYWGSMRKAGFHWIADALVRLGWDVVFITTSLSWLSVLRRDYRLAYPVRAEAGKLIRINAQLSSYVWFTPWHPANMRWSVLNSMTYQTFRKYGRLPLGEAEAAVTECDLVILESTAGLMLFEQLRKLNTQARYIYRVSDDLHFLRCHPAVTDFESQAASQFDLISVPSTNLARKFDGLPHVRVHHHGIDKTLYDSESVNPYRPNSVNAVLVGTSHIDSDFLRRASRLRPDWDFHLIGPILAPAGRSNIVAHGEMRFVDTVPYVKHADVGLQARSHYRGAESLSDSLKVIQYSYCRLPVVAPRFMAGDRPNMIYYTPRIDASIAQALTLAEQYDRRQIDTGLVRTWDEVVAELLS